MMNIERGSGWAVLDTQRGLWVQAKTARHGPWRRRCFAPPGALTSPRLSPPLHPVRFSGYLDSWFSIDL